MTRDTRPKGQRYPGLFVCLLAGCAVFEEEPFEFEDTAEPHHLDALPGQLEDGLLYVCLAGPEVATPGWRYEVQGTVAGFGPPEGEWNLYPCALDDAPGAVLEIVDAEGQSWFVGWKIVKFRGDDGTPEPDVEAGQTVSLDFWFHEGFSRGASFVVEDPSGLVAAVEGGTGEIARSGAVPGLDVMEGEETERWRTECGVVQEHALHFVGDDLVVLEPYARGGVRLGGVDYSAFAITAYTLVHAECTDIGGDRAWAVFR